MVQTYLRLFPLWEHPHCVLQKCCSGLLRLEKTSVLTKPNPCPITTSFSATSPWFLNTSRDGDCPTSLCSCALRRICPIIQPDPPLVQLEAIISHLSKKKVLNLGRTKQCSGAAVLGNPSSHIPSSVLNAEIHSLGCLVDPIPP